MIDYVNAEWPRQIVFFQLFLLFEEQEKGEGNERGGVGSQVSYQLGIIY